jgi:hypothetical protein
MLNFTGFIPTYDEHNIYRNLKDEITTYLFELLTEKPYLCEEEVSDIMLNDFTITHDFTKREVERELYFINRCVASIKKGN